VSTPEDSHKSKQLMTKVSKVSNTHKIKVTYFNNKLSLDDVSKEEQNRIRELWIRLREDYTDWVAEVRMEDFGIGKPLVELLPWKGMSTWWLNPLVRKDIVSFDTRWLHHLMLLYLFRAYPGRVDLETDDFLLVKTIRKNLRIESVRYFSSPKSKKWHFIKGFLVNFISLIMSMLSHVKISLMLFGYRKRQIMRYKGLRSSVWFWSIYPGNWIKDENKNWQDRLLTGSPLDDHKHSETSRYLINLHQYRKDARTNIFRLRKELNCFEEKAQREIAFVQAHLRLKDIIEVYYSSFVEWLKYKRWQRLTSFKKLFRINGLDVADILLRKWESGYKGNLQYNKLQGLAMARFLQDIHGGHTIVTYGEFFVQCRAAYHLCNLLNPKATFVALQHAMNVKNRMFTYHRKAEFAEASTSDHICFLPAPNKFLTQGAQYSEIVTEFFDSNNVGIIGSLKYDHYDSVRRNNKKIIRHCNEKLNLNNSKMLLLAPSTDDHQEIIDIFSCWQGKDNWKVVLSPHPVSDVNAIKAYKEKLYPNLEIYFETTLRTYELMTVSSLVITGFSTTAIEACFFGVRSVRFLNLGTFPLFDYEVSIPVFHDGPSFIEWFESQNWENNENEAAKQEMDEIISRYFYKIDGKASDRLWEFLCTQFDLPHNQSRNFKNCERENCCIE